MKENIVGVVGIWLFAVCLASPVLAGEAGYDEQAVAKFYRGKTVTIVVGHSAGGGFDTYARIISRHLGKHIPGSPNVMVNNMAGAGTMISANYTYNQAAKDGTVINSFDGGIVPSQIYGASSVQFDLAKFNYIGAPDTFKYVMAVTRKPGIGKMQDFINGGKPIVIGATPNTAMQHSAMLLKEFFGGHVKVVSGFKGTAEVRLAMKSGEIDSVITGWESLRVTNLQEFESGEWLILSQWVDEPLSDLPQKNVPLIYQFARGEEERGLFKFGVIKPNSYARPYVLPPGVPQDRARAMEVAFQKTLGDPELLAEAEKSKLNISPISGAQLRAMIVEGLSMPVQLKQKLRPMLAPAG
jgi:tripartite-type tricarboxylate transporter receptor subunit TctC